MSWPFFVNAFGWTFLQKQVGPDGVERPVYGEDANCPLVTWLVQDEFGELVIRGIEEGFSINDDKSREMGASWIVISVHLWWWIFRSNSTFIWASRVEDEVDKRGNMDTLFEKARYFLKFLPTWLRPRYRSAFMILENLDNGSVCIGSSTNVDVGRGGRKTAALVDEAAAIRNLEEIDSSLSQTTASVCYVSTPHGPGTWFAKRIKQGLGRHFVMHWTRHPEKSRGAHQILTPDKKAKWTSPWYEAKTHGMSKKAVAQEIDLDHGAAGDMFFDIEAVNLHRMRHAAPPMLIGDLVWIGEDPGEGAKKKAIQSLNHRAVKFIERADGRLRLWVPLEDGRLPQQWTYCISSDIALGSGGSNSVSTISAKEPGRIVAKFWNAFIPPEEFAEMTMMLGVWAGGRRDQAMLIWENNGPGSIFGNKVVKWRYRFFYRQRVEGDIRSKKTSKWGWNSGGPRKPKLLGEYRGALESDRIVNPCHQALDEAIDYIWSENGEVMPGRLVEEAAGGRALHGDHVISDALGWKGLDEITAQYDRMLRPPPGSFAHRREVRRKQDRRAKDAFLE